MGDLIVANCYLLKKGMERATLTDYEDLRPDGSFGTVEVELDARLQPGANAQRYFKKYTKSRNAKTELAKQIESYNSDVKAANLEYDATLENAFTVTSSISPLEIVYKTLDIIKNLFK
jgi:predicted ribosome quality control (RQC) complex YloA/Tae2 family protein